MKESEYIRAGVELADGWRVNDLDEQVIHCGFGLIQVLDCIKPQYLDALAAQLVRQVDEAGKEANLYCEVLIEECRAGECMDWPPDRTMNTIKAIIDSGVLK